MSAYMTQPKPPSGFVHLVLKEPFYLEIPVRIVKEVSLKPLKYLRYIGWCVLGVLGSLVDESGNLVELNGGLTDGDVYHYNVPDEDIFAYAVDPEVIKQRSQVPSETTVTREDFRGEVLQRDSCCVWTGVSGGNAMHIIPHRRGNEVC
jgi:hypothetical protein